MRIQDISTFNAAHEAGLAKLLPARPRIAPGMGTCGSGNGSEGVFHAFADAIERQGTDVAMVRTGCFGYCAEEPLVNVWLPGKPLVILRRVQAHDADAILQEVSRGRVPPELALCKIEEWDHLTAQIRYGSGYPEIPHWRDIPFFKGQKKIVLRNCGLINPDDIEEYIAIGGYQSLYKVLIDGTPELVNEQLKIARLRGRGGAGFPAGVKWKTVLDTGSDCESALDGVKFVCCNADEGDSGTFADRMLMEGDPFLLIEGMLIAAHAVGAREGFVYIRSEYPDAVATMRAAVDIAYAQGWLGEGVLGSPLRFDLEVRVGGGAYICGEETSMLDSLEGRRGQVRAKPPIPALHGLFGRPTVINNVLTLAAVPTVLAEGAEAYAALGVGRSRGTQVFQLAGNVARGGIVETAFGVTLGDLVEEYGGGTRSGRPIRAVQVGGPLGAYLPVSRFGLPMDYEAFAEAGAMVGHGGVVVFDDTVDMAAQARFAMEFCAEESCGKCTPCRIGSMRGVEVIDRIMKDHQEADLALLEDLCELMTEGSLCAMGGLTPMPVRSALTHFPDDFLSREAPTGAQAEADRPHSTAEDTA
jgi:formate dehydrogenase iron-sulfur subunit